MLLYTIKPRLQPQSNRTSQICSACHMILNLKCHLCPLCGSQAILNSPPLSLTPQNYSSFLALSENVLPLQLLHSCSSSSHTCLLANCKDLKDRSSTHWLLLIQNNNSLTTDLNYDIRNGTTPKLLFLSWRITLTRTWEDWNLLHDLKELKTTNIFRVYSTASAVHLKCFTR